MHCNKVLGMMIAIIVSVALLAVLILFTGTVTILSSSKDYQQIDTNLY
ncbi:hypothetical protein HN512_04770 [Candidatus Peregrinibacteria bacterium]|nr:hypothetical protein [Candidatus Peregrinibacteria bacterium]MBT3599118.1 hypothetical protein [Candidatus Peregrinibacteria bacterium]MBT4367506.1 hypothetical protein [Candidatus Peregrinibacteria bacterium]MBT4585982.1 hypothetical protein [Candidatus Peregrinibacteria bacterium]MBT6730758.1 hypothetical protein [Candidatus Peregrinibacteria bacterium]